LDAAVNAVQDGGLLCISTTDTYVLHGGNPETSFARYGGVATKASYFREMALRVLLHAVFSAAAKYGREVRPLCCCSLDCIRIFVRIFHSPSKTRDFCLKTGMVHQCQACESFWVQQLASVDSERERLRFGAAPVTTPGEKCPECGNHIRISGPIHIGKMCDKEFLDQCGRLIEEGAEHLSVCRPVLTTKERIKSLLTSLSSECDDIVLHYKNTALHNGLNLTPMSARQLRGTLASLGYRVSSFHSDPDSMKTDAPNSVIYDLIRVWAEQQPRQVLAKPQLLEKEINLKRPFSWKLEAIPKAKASRISQKQPEPVERQESNVPASGRLDPMEAEGGIVTTEAGAD